MLNIMQQAKLSYHSEFLEKDEEREKQRFTTNACLERVLVDDHWQHGPWYEICAADGKTTEEGCYVQPNVRCVFWQKVQQQVDRHEQLESQ